MKKEKTTPKWFTDEMELTGMSRQAIARAAGEARKRDRQGWLLTLDYPTYDAVMRHADNRGLRESFYRAWVTRASDQGDGPDWDNSDNIETILALRHEASNLVGFESYAHYSLAMIHRRSGDAEAAARHMALHRRYRGVPPLADRAV